MNKKPVSWLHAAIKLQSHDCTGIAYMSPVPVIRCSRHLHPKHIDSLTLIRETLAPNMVCLNFCALLHLSAIVILRTCSAKWVPNNTSGSHLTCLCHINFQGMPHCCLFRLQVLWLRIFPNVMVVARYAFRISLGHFRGRLEGVGVPRNILWGLWSRIAFLRIIKKYDALLSF